MNFEEWFADYYKGSGFKPSWKLLAREAWDTACAEKEARIAELEKKLERLQAYRCKVENWIEESGNREIAAKCAYDAAPRRLK